MIKQLTKKQLTSSKVKFRSYGKSGHDDLCTCGETFQSGHSVQYTTEREDGTSVIKSFPVDVCSNCGTILLLKSFVDELEKFAKSVPCGFRLIPETGISTPKFLEILVGAFDTEFGSHLAISKRFRGINVRIGTPSRLFKRSLDYITDWDTSDYGHDVMPTLRITPGPPYNDEQINNIHVVLARIRKDANCKLVFWTTHFLPDDDEYKYETKRLLTLVELWPADSDDKMALKLSNDISNDVEPGVFINSFRLLELVLNRLLDSDVLNSRNDPSITSSDFVKMVKLHQADLKTRLSHRIKSQPIYPEDKLKRLWRIMEPDKSFNKDAVCEKIASFRNSYVHKPGESNNYDFPWEVPNFNLFSLLLVSLINDFLNP